MVHKRFRDLGMVGVECVGWTFIVSFQVNMRIERFLLEIQRGFQGHNLLLLRGYIKQ
jgi:hypothetical protein